MAIDPSPTADATRFTELCRTSPAANTPGCAGFEQVGVPSQGPASSQVRAGQDEAPLVAPDHLGQPVGEWLRADQDEQPVGRLCAGIACVLVPESELLQTSIAVA